MKLIVFIMGLLPMCVTLLAGELWAETVVIRNFDHGQNLQKVEFTKIPKRVITTNGSTTEMMLRLGLGEYVVGTAYQDNPVMPDLQEAYQKLPILSSRYPNKEMVLAQEPDFIFGWHSVFAPQVLGDVHYWQGLGVKTFITRNSILNPKTVANSLDDIRDIGRIFKVEERAEAFIRQTQRDINYIQNSIPQKGPRPRVVMGSLAQHGILRAHSPKTLVGNMLELAGGHNVFATDGTYSLEDIIAADPEIIIIVHYAHDQYPVTEQRQMILNHPLFREVKAVKNNRIYGLPLAEAYSAGVRIPVGIKRLASYLYPDFS